MDELNTLATVRVVGELGRRGTAPEGLGNESACEPHAACRWADAIVRVIDSPTDLRTILVWARYIGASPGALRNWCRMSRLSAKRSLAFARTLRAVVKQSHTKLPPQDLLDIVDARTLAKILALGCPTSLPRHALPQSLDEFFHEQQWVLNETALDRVRVLLQRFA